MSLPANKRNQRGFSLIELLISLIVMTIVTTAILAMMKDGIKVSNSTYEMTDAQESLRTAQEFISRDLVVAGDGLRGISVVSLPEIFVRNYLTTTPAPDSINNGVVNMSILSSDNNVAAGTVVRNRPTTVTVRSTPRQTDRITMLEIDRTFNAITLPPNTSINTTGLNVVVSPADVGRFRVGEIYFINSELGATFGTITSITGVGGTRPTLVFAAGDTFGLNQPVNGGPISNVSAKGTLPTSLLRMQIVHYFIDSNGLLIRRVFGVVGAGFADSVVAEHVTNLSFRYALNLPDANGFTQQPVAQLVDTDRQSAVRSVEVTIATETVHHTVTQNINGQPRPARQELTMTTSTSVRNLQFREATQPQSDDPALFD